MATRKNNYGKNTRKKSALSGITQSLETKGNLKNTAIETAKDLVAGVVAGGIAGAAIGKASLAVGTVITGIGHYTKSRLTSIFGVGMMASNGFQKPADQVSGTENEATMLEGVKERLTTYKKSFMQKLFLDKILKKKEESTSSEGTSGIGAVKYFVYPGNKSKELDMSELDRIEKAVAESGQQFTQEQQTAGFEGLNDMPDPDEKIY